MREEELPSGMSTTARIDSCYELRTPEPLINCNTERERSDQFAPCYGRIKHHRKSDFLHQRKQHRANYVFVGELECEHHSVIDTKKQEEGGKSRMQVCGGAICTACLIVSRIRDLGELKGGKWGDESFSGVSRQITVIGRSKQIK